MLDVSINFDQSHWFFPKIIIVFLSALLLIIFYKQKAEIINHIRVFSFKKVYNQNNFKAYLFVILMCFYILGMEMLGETFPNTGYGFLFASIPALLIISLLIENKITAKKLMIISVNSIVSPIVAWFVLGQIFGITLP